MLTAPWNDLKPAICSYLPRPWCFVHPNEMREARSQGSGRAVRCAGSSLWMKERWGSWYGVAKSRGRHPGPILSDEDYRDFDEWMWEEVAKARRPSDKLKFS